MAYSCFVTGLKG